MKTGKRVTVPEDWIASDNPVRRALAMDALAKSGRVKNRAELARRMGISRARVTQLLALTGLAAEVIETLAQLAYFPRPLSERVLREKFLSWSEARQVGKLKEYVAWKLSRCGGRK